MKNGALVKSAATSALLMVAVCLPEWGRAQNQNAEFVRPPVVVPPKAVEDPAHPAPRPYSEPKYPPGTPRDRGPLPRDIANGKYKENPDNLIRNWLNRRPMKERQRAIREARAMPSEPKPAATTPTALPISEAPLQPTTTGWSQIGSGDWVPDGIHYSAGRIRQAAYAYDNAQGLTVLWLGATGGGLWKAIDLFFAVAFVSVSDNLFGSPSVGAFLVQPGNSNNILIGTGDLFRYPGTGMYKTISGGSSWFPVYPTDGTFFPGTFQKILIDVNDPTNNTVLAQGDSGIWRSTDFGTTWSQVYSGSTSDLAQDTVHPWIWYAGAPGTGVLRSTSYGTSFAPIGSGITGPVGRVSVALSPAAPWHVYAITATPNSKGVSVSLGGIWRSDDYGDGTWNLLETMDHISWGQAFHTTSINVDPNNADIVFAGMGGMEVTYNGTANPPTWKYDSGSVSGGFDAGHEDHTGFVFEPGTSNVVSICDGGVYVFNESSLSVSGSLNYLTDLNVQQVFGPMGDLACSRSLPDECIAGLQDNHTVTYDRNKTPTIVESGFGDGGQASIAPDNANELFQMDNGGRYYSTDGGSTWIGDYGSCLPNNYYATTMIDQTPPSGFTPFIYTFSVPTATSTSSYIYYKPVDPNCDWAAANSTHPFDTKTFSPRSMDASNDPNAYVFYVLGWGTGRLYVSDSYSDGSLGTMSYEDRTPGLPFGSSNNDSQLAADRSSSRPYTVTYVTGAARPSRAFLSNDRGQTWKDVTGDLATNLPDASYWKLVANPADQTQLFLGTDQGIFRSDNGGVNWYSYMNGLPAVASIFGLELNHDIASPPLLHIGTYGRGFFDRQVAPDSVLNRVTVTPSTLVGGTATTFVVWLDRNAPVDATVSLHSDNQTLFPLPSSITVTAGYHNAGIVITSKPVSAITTFNVSATYNQLTKSATVTLTPPPPTVSSVSPVAGPTVGGNTVTINGTNFVSASSVKFGTTASSSVMFVSTTQLKAVAPAQVAGTVDVTVTTLAGTSGIVAGDHYTYDLPPTVSSLSPAAGPTAGGNTVTINGTNFLSGASVKFGTTASGSITFVSATQLKAVVPAHAAGTVDVTVTTPGGTSALVSRDNYAYGPPTVSSFTPTSGITGSSVTISGTSFVPGEVVKFGTKTSTGFTFVSGTQIQATVPNGAVTGKISVTTAAGTGTSASNFTVTLSITGFSPASGPTGTVVTITGVGFNSSSAVKFNGTAASKLVHVSSTQLKATVPSAATTGPITVTNTTTPTGTVRSAATYAKT